MSREKDTEMSLPSSDYLCELIFDQFSTQEAVNYLVSVKNEIEKKLEKDLKFQNEILNDTAEYIQILKTQLSRLQYKK